MADLRAALVGGVLLTAACGSGDVSRLGLETSVGTAFGHLYVARQALLEGRPGEPEPAVTTTCDRGGPAVADRGHGDDWVCRVAFVTSVGLPGRASYDLQVRPDGCYKAEGPVPTAPPAVGGQRADPLQEFDGCTA